MSKKLIALIGSLATIFLLCSCVQNLGYNNQVDYSLRSQAAQKPLIKPSTQKEKPRSPDVNQPTSNEHNATPLETRYPFPSVPDESDAPPKEIE